MQFRIVKWITILVIVSAFAGVTAACGRGAEHTSTPTPLASPIATETPRPVVTQSPEKDVLNAYVRYWKVYTEALFGLDESHLAEVMAGPRLDRAIQEIRSLSAQGRAVRIVVENDPAVASIVGDVAQVIDVYKNSSYQIDAVTKQPVAGTGTPNVLRDTVTLERVGGVWKVRDAVRQVDTR